MVMKKRVVLLVVACTAVLAIGWYFIANLGKFSMADKVSEGIVRRDSVRVSHPILIAQSGAAFMKAAYDGQNKLSPISNGVILEVYGKPSHTYFEGEAILKVFQQNEDSTKFEVVDIKSPCNCTILNGFKIGQKLANPSFLEIRDKSGLLKVTLPKSLYDYNESYYKEVKGVVAPRMNEFEKFELKDWYVSGKDVVLSYSPKNKEAVNPLLDEVWLDVNMDFGITYKVPESAVYVQNGSSSIFKLVNNKLVNIPVNVLSTENSFSLFKGDFSSTDQIILFPSDSLLNSDFIYPLM